MGLVATAVLLPLALLVEASRDHIGSVDWSTISPRALLAVFGLLFFVLSVVGWFSLSPKKRKQSDSTMS